MLTFGVQILKTILVLLSLTTHHLYAAGSYSVGDPLQDYNFDFQDLPRYTRLTCQTQAKALEVEADRFKYDQKKDFIFLPHTIRPEVILKIDHIAEDDRNNNFFLTKLRKNLESSVSALKNHDFFTVNAHGCFEFAFDDKDPKSLIVFYVQMASELSLNYSKLIELRNQIQNLPKNTPESQRAIFYAFFKARVHLDESLANIIHAMRPHILKFKESLVERDIHEKLAQVELGLKRISSAEAAYISETKKIAQKAFSHPEVQNAWREAQK